MNKYIICGLALMGMLNACSPDSPDTTVDEYAQTEDAMASWVNGIDKQMALAVGDYAELLDVATDNYYNIYSRSNREFDKPNILYTDYDVEDLQRYVGKLREMSEFALNTLAQSQTPTTEQLISIYTALAYSYLLAGENFVALPIENGGQPVSAEEHLKKAIDVLNEANGVLNNNRDFSPTYHTLMARAYRLLGNAERAGAHATEALAAGGTFVNYVEFDEANSVVSGIKDRSYSTNWWEPLPRLDFLDPKYQAQQESQRIAIAKAEEDFLILVEVAAATSKSALTVAKQAILPELFSLIESRATATFTDSLEMRAYTIGGVDYNLNTSQWLVRASADDEARSGLILNRARGSITVPSLSGTSLTLSEMQAADGDRFLELLYQLRQEVFFAEGRRFADLGMRLPLCEVELTKLQQSYPDTDFSAYTKAYIPSFIPTEDYGMDAFTVDQATHTVTITHNMNRLLVKGGALPFAKQ